MPRARTLLDEFRLEQYEVTPRVIPVTPPAAGSDWSVFVPGGVVWYVQTIIGTVAYSAAVANRVARVGFSEGSNEFLRVPVGNTDTASTSVVYVWATGIGFQGTNTGTGRVNSLPKIPLTAGMKIASAILNIDAGDQWSNVVLYVIELDPLNLPQEEELA